jgi:methylthioribose-1-phosphate isomerase
MLNLDGLIPTRWNGDAGGDLVIVDQTRLPAERVELKLEHVEAVYEAIKSLRVRGAPAIGVAAAYGMVIVARSSLGDGEALMTHVEAGHRRLASSRPTAVNLFWALEQQKKVWSSGKPELQTRAAMSAALLARAQEIEREDRAMCERIGAFGAPLLQDGGILTHCNAGPLATSGYGTALGMIFSAVDDGRALHVFADETRPLLQGARLTAYELQKAGVPVTLITDNMAAAVMRSGKVGAVVVGADRIAANGDVANKIGTYGVAVLAKHHGIPFYVAAPFSTFDLTLASGDGIPIEERHPSEVRGFGQSVTAPEGVAVFNPAFDVTPAALITAIVTDRGVIQPPNREAVAAVAASSGTG